MVIFKLSSTDEAPFKLTHTNNTEGQQNLLQYVGSYKCFTSTNMAIRISGTNSYIQLTVTTITDGQKMLKNSTKIFFAVQIQPTAQLRCQGH